LSHPARRNQSRLWGADVFVDWAIVAVVIVVELTVAIVYTVKSIGWPRPSDKPHKPPGAGRSGQSV
jgi:hypothetical protein